VCVIAAFALVIAAGLPDRARVTAIGYLPDGLPIAPEVGGVAPALTLFDLNGKPFSVPRNTPLVINFWATWCPPCVYELPMLDDLQKKYPMVRVIAVNMGENPDTVRAWLAQTPLSLPIALDPEQAMFQRYRVRGAPSTFFIDSAGVIRQIVYGALPPDGLESRVKTILD
jgi:thiol-disulfide isomerase/thioredoxin